jgi:pimeloyl-ACP methyl ester carboxylesterase
VSTETVETDAGGSANVSSPPEEGPVAIVDEEVLIDDARTHIRCIGSGDVTVVIIPGHGDPGASWRVPAGLLSADARVCYYSHLGTGQSDPRPTVQTFTGRADRLHAVLEAVGEAGPYVVVGHSIGGGEAVAFASMFADDVVGVVLVDATPAGMPEAVCASQPADVCARRMDPDNDPERLDFPGSFAEIAKIGSLGAMPIVVLTAAAPGHADGYAELGVDAAGAAHLEDVWQQGQQAWAELSTKGQVVVVADSGHFIHVDQPAIVLDHIRALLDASTAPPTTTSPTDRLGSSGYTGTATFRSTTRSASPSTTEIIGPTGTEAPRRRERRT